MGLLNIYPFIITIIIIIIAIIIDIIIIIIIITDIIDFIDIIIIIDIIDYYTQSIAASCSSRFCESGQQPVVKGLTESCKMIIIMFT